MRDESAGVEGTQVWDLRVRRAFPVDPNRSVPCRRRGGSGGAVPACLPRAATAVFDHVAVHVGDPEAPSGPVRTMTGTAPAVLAREEVGSRFPADALRGKGAFCQGSGRAAGRGCGRVRRRRPSSRCRRRDGCRGRSCRRRRRCSGRPVGSCESVSRAGLAAKTGGFETPAAGPVHRARRGGDCGAGSGRAGT